MPTTRVLVAALLLASPAPAQVPNDPFPDPIPATEGAIVVDFVELARIPDVAGGPPRVMHLVDEPGTQRMFAVDMRGPLFSVSYDGRRIVQYLDVDEARWGVGVESTGSERGIQSFAFHPQFGQAGTPGYGKLYVWTDTDDLAPPPDFPPASDDDAHDTVLLEFTARDAATATYDGGPPRELMRFQQPFRNHNGGMIGFNPLASPGDEDFGLLYVGIADGGSGGDPLDMSQNLASGFGKIFRVDPLGSGSANGEYGIPAGNPFAGDGNDRTLGEIWAHGVRNPQRFAWDPATARMFLADIGQNVVEELSVVTRGANLGWNDWEGSFRWISRQAVDLSRPRSDPSVTYPVAEWGQPDPLLQSSSAASGVFVYRGTAIPELTGKVLFGDNPSGEIFWIDADDLPDGGQAPIRRVLLNDGGVAKHLLLIIQEGQAAQGLQTSRRVDMRLAAGPDGQVVILNKQDGILRALVP